MPCHPPLHKEGFRLPHKTTNPPQAAPILFTIHFYLFSQNRRHRFSSLFTFICSLRIGGTDSLLYSLLSVLSKSAAPILFSIHFYLFSQNRRYRFSSLFTFPYLFLLKKTHNNVIIKIETNADNNFIPYHTKQTQGGNQNERNIKSQRA